jgi:formylmethanofuran dehydrogenase subunit E
MIDKERLMEILEEEECLTADGFDEALVGCTYGANVVAVYDINKMIEVLILEGLEYDDAVEFIEYNIVGAHLGDKTPQYVNFVTQEIHND